MEINKEAYNKIADRWYEYRQKAALNKCIVEFSRKIKPAGKILDIGCGTGYPIANYFSEQGFAVTGIDISENMLKAAVSQRLPHAKFYLCDFFAFKPTEKYDGIVAFDSLFHFPKEKQTEIYQILSDWLNIGGYLLFTHGKQESEIRSYMFGELFYYSALNTQDVHQLLADSGFVIELSAEDYTEENSDRELLIIAKKII